MVRVDSEWECCKNLCCHIFCAIVLDVVFELARKGVLGALLHADDLVLVNETTETVRNRLIE